MRGILAYILAAPPFYVLGAALTDAWWQLALFMAGCTLVAGAIWAVGRPQPWRPPAREHCGSRAHFMGLPCPCQDARDD